MGQRLRAPQALLLLAVVVLSACTGTDPAEDAERPGGSKSDDGGYAQDLTTGQQAVTVELRDHPGFPERAVFAVRFIGTDGSVIEERTLHMSDSREQGGDSLRGEDWTLEVAVPPGQITVQSELSRVAGAMPGPPRFEDPCVRSIAVGGALTLTLDWDTGCLRT